MTVHLFNSDKGIPYATLHTCAFDITYEENIIGLLSRVRFQLNENCINGTDVENEQSARPQEKGEVFDLTALHIPQVRQVDHLIKQTAKNILLICARLGLTLESAETSTECCYHFIAEIKRHQLARLEELNWSSLGLDSVPPHIGLFSQVKRLDLSKNLLRVLPRELIKLEHLETIDLRGNPIVNLPAWLVEWQEANPTIREILWDDKKCKPEQLAQSLLCSQQHRNFTVGREVLGKRKANCINS